MFNDCATKNLPGVDTAFVQRVRARQPFVKHPPHPEAHPLAVLHELSNKDKHRQLRLTAVDVRVLDWNLVNEKNFQKTAILHRTLPRFEPGAEIGRVEGRVIGGEPEVNVEGAVGLQVLFTDPNTVATTALKVITEEVTSILDEFDPLLS